MIDLLTTIIQAFAVILVAIRITTWSPARRVTTFGARDVVRVMGRRK